MSYIFLFLELIALVTLLARFLNVSGMILFFLLSFYFLSTYSISFPTHGNEFTAFIDLKSLFVITTLCCLSINKIKNAYINFDVLLLNLFSALLVLSIFFDFLSMPVDKFLVGSAYKFGFLMNTILVNRLVNRAKYNLGFIFISIVPFNKWMVFYYLHLILQRFKPKFSNIIFYLAIIIFASFSIQVVYGSLIDYLFGRVVATDISGNLFLRDGSRQVIWQYLLSNAEIFNLIPNFGSWYLSYDDVGIHDHNIFVFLVSRLSYLLGGILFFFTIFKLHRLFSALRFRLLYLNYILIFFVSALWANILFIYSLIILVAVSSKHHEDKTREMAS